MPREKTTLAEISQWLTTRVRKDPRCQDAEITVMYQLAEPDESGCNWSRDIMVNVGTGDDVEVHKALAKHFEKARRRFNVGD